MEKVVLQTYLTLCEQYSASVATPDDKHLSPYYEELKAFTEKLLDDDPGCLFKLLQFHLNNNDLANLSLIGEIVQ